MRSQCRCRSSGRRVGGGDAASCSASTSASFPGEKLADGGVLGDRLESALELAPVARQPERRERIQRMLRWLDGDGSGGDRFGAHQWLFPSSIWRRGLAVHGWRAGVALSGPHRCPYRPRC